MQEKATHRVSLCIFKTQKPYPMVLEPYSQYASMMSMATWNKNTNMKKKTQSLSDHKMEDTKIKYKT